VKLKSTKFEIIKKQNAGNNKFLFGSKRYPKKIIDAYKNEK
jgi:hypothetical protein